MRFWRNRSSVSPATAPTTERILNLKTFRALLLLCVICLLQSAFAGSCADHIKILNIANIQTDNSNIMVRSDSYKPGSGFAPMLNGVVYPLSGTPTANIFLLQASQDPNFVKNSMSELLNAKSTGEIVYLQVTPVSPYCYQILKVALGASSAGLDCTNYPWTQFGWSRILLE